MALFGGRNAPEPHVGLLETEISELAELPSYPSLGDSQILSLAAVKSKHCSRSRVKYVSPGSGVLCIECPCQLAGTSFLACGQAMVGWVHYCERMLVTY